MFGIGFITVVSHLRICGTNNVGSKGVTRDGVTYLTGSRVTTDTGNMECRYFIR